GKDVARDLALVAERGREIIFQAAGEMELRLGRRLVLLADQRRVAAPADLDAAEQIGLGARHAVEARRLEGGALAEDLRIWLEAGPGAAAVVHLAELLQPPQRHAPGKTLAVELAPARDLDLAGFRQRIDHRDADSVQAARGLIGLVVELAAGMQR